MNEKMLLYYKEEFKRRVEYDYQQNNISRYKYDILKVELENGSLEYLYGMYQAYILFLE